MTILEVKVVAVFQGDCPLLLSSIPKFQRTFSSVKVD
jgi:hypothetical protein